MITTPSDNHRRREILWAQLVDLEPRLAGLEEQCRSYRGRHRLDYWYRSVKPQLVVLVGWFRRDRAGDDVLGTIGAYDVAYGHLLATLTRPRRARVERRGRAA